MTAREIADMILIEHKKFVYRVYFGKQYIDTDMILTDTILYGIAYDMILRGDY